MKNVELIIPDKDHKFDEAMKTLRTNIQFSGAGIRKVMITSTEPDEGKSRLLLILLCPLLTQEKKFFWLTPISERAY